jgi:hypothetical protein
VGYRVRPGSSSADRQLSLENWRRARRRIRADFPQIPQFVHKWSDARRLLEFAPGFAFDGQLSTSAALLARSLALDPARTSRVLFYHVRRKLRGARRTVQAAGPLFRECNPERNYRVAEFEVSSEARPIRALDASRQQLLGSLGEKIARRVAAKDPGGR